MKTMFKFKNNIAYSKCILKLIVRMQVACLVIGCTGYTNRFKDLEDKYESKEPVSGDVINSESPILWSKKRSHEFGDHDFISVRLNDTGISLTPSGLDSIFYNSVTIPSNDISACSMICFGKNDWLSVAIVDSVGTSIMVPMSKDLLSWCNNNNKIFISSEDLHEWQASELQIIPNGINESASESEYIKIALAECN